MELRFIHQESQTVFSLQSECPLLAGHPMQPKLREAWVRPECLSLYWCLSSKGARVKMDRWREMYHHQRSQPTGLQDPGGVCTSHRKKEEKQSNLNQNFAESLDQFLDKDPPDSYSMRHQGKVTCTENTLAFSAHVADQMKSCLLPL